MWKPRPRIYPYNIIEADHHRSPGITIHQRDCCVVFIAPQNPTRIYRGHNPPEDFVTTRAVV
jgi:hypothetical protein